MKVILTGGAGLVGQNLILLLFEQGFSDLTILDKNRHNLNILQELNPGVNALCADLAEEGDWQKELQDADVLISLQAQIGGLNEQEFVRNNVLASENIVGALANNTQCYIVHVSSSVLDSKADDFYTRSKRAQEEIFTALQNPICVLRPTLMFGWFDRKHLGWLARFMAKLPIFPVPGNGRYLRQPLYVRDFCRVIASCIDKRFDGQTFSITGKERITYIDIIRHIKTVTGKKTWITCIPYALFYALLKVYAVFDRNPPFTVTQLQALVIDELFEEIDWESEFAVQATPFSVAAKETFTDERYADVVLEF